MTNYQSGAYIKVNNSIFIVVKYSAGINVIRAKRFKCNGTDTLINAEDKNTIAYLTPKELDKLDVPDNDRILQQQSWAKDLVLIKCLTDPHHNGHTIVILTDCQKAFCWQCKVEFSESWIYSYYWNATRSSYKNVDLPDFPILVSEDIKSRVEKIRKQLNANPTLAISDFLRRQTKDSGHSYFDGEESQLLSLIKENWEKRVPGRGRSDLSKVVVVPLPPDKFVGTTVKLKHNMVLESMVDQREPGEDLFVSTRATHQITYTVDWGQTKITNKIVADPVKYASIVLYSADTLLENNGKRSSDADWEAVAIIASDVENEPMHPLTMARNFLEKPGGTKAVYTANDFAESIYYWSQRVRVKRDVESVTTND